MPRALTVKQMAKLGGLARARQLTPARRRAIASHAGRTRWARHRAAQVPVNGK